MSWGDSMKAACSLTLWTVLQKSFKPQDIKLFYWVKVSACSKQIRFVTHLQAKVSMALLNAQTNSLSSQRGTRRDESNMTVSPCRHSWCCTALSTQTHYRCNYVKNEKGRLEIFGLDTNITSPVPMFVLHEPVLPIPDTIMRAWSDPPPH